MHNTLLNMKSPHSFVTKMYEKMSSVHGSSVLTVKQKSPLVLFRGSPSGVLLNGTIFRFITGQLFGKLLLKFLLE